MVTKLSGALKRSVGLGKLVKRNTAYKLLNLKKPEELVEEITQRVNKKLTRCFPEFASLKNEDKLTNGADRSRV